jgi:hypothetical protein
MPSEKSLAGRQGHDRAVITAHAVDGDAHGARCIRHCTVSVKGLCPHASATTNPPAGCRRDDVSLVELVACLIRLEQADAEASACVAT